MMSFVKNILWLKPIAAFISLMIVSLILWNTYSFFQKFKEDERAKMKIYATAIKELAINSDLDASFNLETKIFEELKNIPLILTDEKGIITDFRNLDSLKATSPRYLKKQLELMKRQNEPIEIMYIKNKKQFVYYRDSDLLNKLTYYPLALILILFLFLSVVYLFFNSNKIAEQNKLWTGMAKETAHQIGTPLSSLLGWIAILKMEKVTDKYIEEIEKDVHRLNTIANRFSKIGSIPLLTKGDLVLATKTTFNYLKNRSSKQISFIFSSQESSVYVHLNTALFGWVIENLIKNAIDAMQGKGVLNLTIKTTQKKVEIMISDTGKGISKSQFKQIFKPGFTTKRRGWGLGLSLSKRIIDDYHKGKIFVEKSEVGSGTSFKILLNKVT